MSRIPNSAIPRAWTDDSEHAEDVRRARDKTGDRRPFLLTFAVIASLAYFGFKLLSARRAHA